MLGLLRPKRHRARAARCAFKGTVELMEERLLMTATPEGRTTFSVSAEKSSTYSANGYAAVLSGSGLGTGSYYYAQWNFQEFGTDSKVFTINSGTSDVTGLTYKLYNTASSGNYRPHAGQFSIYVIPDDSVSSSTVRMQPTSGSNAPGNTGASALGTVSGGASTLGITGNANDWKVGSWTITDSLPVGYTSFVASTSGSSVVGSGASGVASATMGALAREAIKNDLNNQTPLRFAIVADDLSFAADWEGNYSSNYPLLTLDYTPAPLVALSSSTYTVTEADQVPANTTPLTFNVTRTSDPSTTTTVHWAASNIDVPAGGFTAQSGDVTFAPGQTSKPVTIYFKDITTSQLHGNVGISVSDPGQSGGDIAPVFKAGAGGTTATATINYLQSYRVDVAQTTASVNQTDGTVTIQVNRTGSGAQATDVQYSTADGMPYVTDTQAEGNAVAGRDYTATSGTLHWDANDTTPRMITIPINAALKTFAGTRDFTVSLSSPSNGTMIGVDTSTVTITDNAVPNSQVLSGMPTETVPVETGGPYTSYTNSFMAFNSQVHGSFGYASMPLLKFEDPSTIFPTSAIGNVDSVRLSIYNTAITGGYAGTPGRFDVYILDDDSVPDSSLRYGGGTGATGPVVIGSQASPILLGTAYFPNNVVGYNDFTFDNLSPSAQASLQADLNAGTMIRMVITPSAGSPVAADWEGNWVQNQPILSVLAEAPVTLPAWLAPNSDAAWDAGTHTLTVNGAATIIADPGSDSPKIVANGASAQLTIAPATVGLVHLGGVTLTNGAGITVPSVGAGRTHTNHNVIVIDANGMTPGTFSIDTSSNFDLVDNDMVVKHGNLATIAGLATAARNVTPGVGGDWTGNGLTSSAAKDAYAANFFEQYLLAVATNGSLYSGGFSEWQAGSDLLPLAVDDVLVKYTYNGDFDLDGKVDDNDFAPLGGNYDGGVYDMYAYIDGDTNGDGKVDDNDIGTFGGAYGSGWLFGDQL